MTQSAHIHVHRYDKHDTPHALGRHVEHDSRSRAFTFVPTGPVPERSVVWPHNTPVLNQGQIGSCTGNAMAQLLNCKLFAPCRMNKVSLTEKDALALYSGATHNDGGGSDQYYPPHDDGASGIGVAKAAQQIGYIDSYLHCFTLAQVQAAIQTQPLIVGTPWTNAMFTPDPTTGQVSPGELNDETIVGGHEYLCQGVDFASGSLIFLNSWGTGWGGGQGLTPGQFRISFADFTNLLAAEGDAVVPRSKKVVTG